MSKAKSFELIINVNGIPEEVFPEVTDRIQSAVRAIIEEYGAQGVKCEKKVKS